MLRAGSKRKSVEMENLVAGGCGAAATGSMRDVGDIDEKRWENSGRCGFQMMDIDTKSNRWATCGANSFLASFAGLHREEFLARMGNHDMGLASSELRQLCAHVGAVLLSCRPVIKSLQEGTAPVPAAVRDQVGVDWVL